MKALRTDKGEKMQEKETLDEKLPALFEPDTLLPIQYFEAMRKKHLLEGEKRLILSVLEDAIECFMKCIDAATNKGQRLFREADEWIAHEDKRWVFSFDNVCDMLDINPEYMRMGLRKWKDKRIDAIARRRAQMVLEAERAAAEGATACRRRRCDSSAGAGCGRGRNAEARDQGRRKDCGGARQAPPRARARRQARVSAQAAQSTRITTGTQEATAASRGRRLFAFAERRAGLSTRAPLPLRLSPLPHFIASMPLRTNRMPPVRRRPGRQARRRMPQLRRAHRRACRPRPRPREAHRAGRRRRRHRAGRRRRRRHQRRDPA